MPKHSVNNIPDGFKDHIKNRFALLNLIDWEPEELWPETRNIGKECEKTMKEKPRWITAETLKMVRSGREAKAKGGKSRV